MLVSVNYQYWVRQPLHTSHVVVVVVVVLLLRSVVVVMIVVVMEDSGPSVKTI